MPRVVVVTVALLASSAAAAHTQQDVRSVAVDLRIGDLDRPDYALTRISDIAVDEQGTMFVGQPQESLIRVYDRNGRFQRSFGREGAGPGEFRSVDTLRMTQRGLLVLDKSQRRLSLLTPTGRPIISWGAPAHQYADGLVGTAPQAVLADGSLIVVPGYTIDPGESMLLPLFQFDRSQAYQKILAWLRVGDNVVRAEVDRLVMAMRQPVTSHTLWCTTHDGREVILVDRQFATTRTPGTFTVVRINLSGDTIGGRQFRVPARRIPRDMIADSLRLKVDMVAATTPFAREQLTALYQQGWNIPEFQAPVDRVIASTDGSVWLRRGAYMEESATWWVLDSRGEIEMRVGIPTRFHVFRVDGEYIWASERGDFDEEYIVRLRIVAPR
jgi:hypothetical protein